MNRLKMPNGLSKPAQAVWPEVEQELAQVKNKPSGIALTMFCETFARWKAATAEVAKKGAVTRCGDSGYEQQSPHVAIVNKTQEQLMRLMADMGVSAAKPKRASEPGKKEEKQRAAESASKGRFAPAAPPRLVVSNG
jgi:P27 family predicted phage terminase small subunit